MGMPHVIVITWSLWFWLAIMALVIFPALSITENATITKHGNTAVLESAHLDTSEAVPKIICDLLKNGGPYPSDWSCAAALADPHIICRNRWTGLSCNNDSSLSALLLSRQGIQGILPSSIGYLTSITKIDLSRNLFRGSLPMQLFNLKNLKVLLLAYNDFTGILPPNIGSVSSLVSMDLSHNVLQSKMPEAIGTLTNLVYLALSHNLLTSVIPATIGSMTSLSFLALGANRLASSIPTTIGLLTNLAWLLLSSNKLTSILPTAIGALINLSSLALGYNQLTSAIPSNIGALTKLTFLGLSSNVFTSCIPSQIGQLTKLVYADLSFNALSSSVPSTISFLNQLTYIALSQNKLTSSLPSGIGNMSSMKNLRLRHCKFTSTIPTSIGMLTKLTVLLLSQNSLTSRVPTTLGKLVNLKTLKLSYNLLTSSIPSELGLMTQLLDLQLSFNRFNSSIPTAIGRLRQLIRLDLESNQLTSSVPTAILVLSTLKYLYLQSNSLQSSIPASVVAMSGVVEISLKQNTFTGTFPISTCQISSLTLLDLANNSFSCVPWCQSDVLWNTPGVSIPRCVDNDDIALSAMDHVLSISVAIGKQVSRQFGTIQEELTLSTHPIVCVQDANAFSYSVDIGPYAYSCPAPLLFCSDEACSSILAQNIATGFDAPLIVNGPSFCYKALSPFLGTSASSCSAFSSMGVIMRITSYLRQQDTWVTRNPVNGTRAVGTSLQSSAVSRVTSGLCQSSWYGINCTGGQVTSLSLAGLGLQGSIPSVIGLLTGLTSLDLSANMLTGTIPSSVGMLTKMDTLKLNGNFLRGVIPSTVQTMSKLYDVDLSSNSLSSTVPSFFGHMAGLRSLNLGSNDFEYEVPSDVCVGIADHGLVVSLLRNPRLTCYQEACLSTNVTTETVSESFGPALRMCVPTSSPTAGPTSRPSSRTASPASLGILVIQPLLTTQQTIIVSVICPLVVVVVLCYVVWLTRFSENAVLRQKKRRLLRSLPLHRLLLKGCGPGHVATEAYVMSIIESNMDSLHRCDGDGNTPLDIIVQGYVHRAVSLTSAHIHRMLLACLPAHIHEEKLIGTDSKRVKFMHGSLQRTLRPSSDFVISTKVPAYGWCLAVQKDDDMFVTAVEMILSEHRQHVKELGDIEDNNRRKCKEIAGARIKESIARKLYLAERFEVDEEHPVHKSLTSLVYFAIDHGAPKSNSAMDTDGADSSRKLNEEKGRDEGLNYMSWRSKRIVGGRQVKEDDSGDGQASPKPSRALAFLNLPSFADPNEGDASEGESEVLIDTPHHQASQVAVKFMRHRDQFLKEVIIRQNGDFDERFVIPLLMAFDGDGDSQEDREFREDSIQKGYGDFPYCIVMEAGSQSLKHTIDHERIANVDWNAIQDITRSLAQCLEHCHSKDVVHGDLKPLNALHVGRSWKLIDMDASANYLIKELVGLKYSSGYIPPEMLYIDAKGEVAVRHPGGVGESGLIAADPSQDMWALGCILYLLCTAHTLFLLNTDDNITQQDDYTALYSWDAETAGKKLASVGDKLAKNLLSLLLNKNPAKRPSAIRVLSHPFLTGQPVSRLQGEDASFDVFLSYRVATESKLVKLFYDSLTAKGLKVWWDKKSLLPGQNWESGFCRGLVCSAYFVALISLDAIKNETNDRQNFEKLQPESPCDNVLLEWQLALELFMRGMIEGVFPLMIGDADDTGVYSHFGARGFPRASDIVVKSVETKLCEHLDREGLGLPYKEHTTVKTTLGTLLANQGAFLEGDLTLAVERISQTILGMVRKPDKTRAIHAPSRHQHIMKEIVHVIKEASLSTRLQASHKENLKQADIISDLINKNSTQANLITHLEQTIANFNQSASEPSSSS